MAIRVSLNHQTGYKFDRSVSLSPHIIRLWPAPHTRTPILSRSIRITPENNFLNWQQDPYSNYLARVVFPEKTKELKVEIDLVVEMVVSNPFDFFVEPEATDFPFNYEAAMARQLIPFTQHDAPGPLLTAWLAHVSPKKMGTVDFIVHLNQRLHEEIKYIIRLEPGVQTPEETLTKGSGSCRDSAWLLVQILRNLGLAARFVSGYSIQLRPDVLALDGGPSGTSSDVADLHAWTEVYIPGAGWVGFDATSGLLAGEGHIPLACTAEPSSAAPISGLTDECKSELTFSLTIGRIDERPRVTKPYSPEQWQSIAAMGHKVDAQLKADDVRLTMGGEPTFVSIDSRDDPEWNTDALGPRKRIIAGDLIKRLRDKFAPAGLLHYGQGKWYPGEPLPRWALGCYWRKDGDPIWENPQLIADENVKAGFKATDAERFALDLAKRLKISESCIIPGYEDAWHYMLQERLLPTNVDPLDNRLKDAETRKRICKVFDQGLSTVVGYALPVDRRLVDGDIRWVSGPWFLRREQMFLLPGDSPMGLRLPLDSLPWAPEADIAFYENDPSAPVPPLPARAVMQQFVLPEKQWLSIGLKWPRPKGIPTQTPVKVGQTFLSTQASLTAGQPGPSISPARRATDILSRTRPDSPGMYDVARTAICVEARDGHLHVFMPPQRYLEDYLNLLSAVEASAAALETPVLIEGYTPPNDCRLNVLKVTPDPGVIEVNMQPSASWDELVKNTEIVYEEARLSRLVTEKFMLDGRHTGTGGGNHIILGGATPQDSPVLRKPELLRSLISFWHNHPSLSYLFSGLFIGPTSQHPRIDEARNDSVYEMELAFKQIAQQKSTPPWLIDRLLRNLLIDSAGNTHRSEFCIDKLYSPDSSSGRLGLLEIRCFEMPPHTQMSLAQQLLLRTLVAKFWRQPYSRELVRWGTELHDRFMLPHFVEQDFSDVLQDLADGGFALKPEWFTPHMHFRFPVHGAFAQRGIDVEVRHALEPWHVLGEDSGAGGTVRYVDSSLERVQVKVRGMTGSRHIATCNGRRLPLFPTGVNGEFIAGVRYRAWQPPNCLQPHIPIQAPLVFDLVDDWNGRSIGGCTYHVVHPGGRSYSTFPVNANEAEGRRAGRFFASGHTPRQMKIPPEEVNPRFPFTLDLRQPIRNANL